jgi:hypothetical protein
MHQYSLVQPPFTLKFREMQKGELREYFRWFRSVVGERIDELSRTVRATSGYETWEPDLTPESLNQLGAWLLRNSNTRPRTFEELQEKNKSSFSIAIPDYELTDRTFSLAMDVGMYLSQVFIKNHPSVRWEQLLTNAKSVDYGQPVLIGLGPVQFNPVRMVITLAYGLASGKDTSEALRELYDIWSKRAQQQL